MVASRQTVLKSAPALSLSRARYPLRPGPRVSQLRAFEARKRRGVTPLRQCAVMAALPGLPLPALAAGAPTLLLGGLVLAALLMLTSKLRSSSNGLSKLPGPKQLPLLGNLPDLGHPRAHQTMAQWTAEHGPLVRFTLASPSVLVTHPSDVEGLLARRGEDELPRPPLIYSPLDPIYSPTRVPSFFTTRDPAMWAAVRKGCAPAFSPETTRRMFPVVRDVVAEVCEHLAALAGTPAGAEGLDMQEASLRVALDSFALTTLQHDFGARHYGRCEVLEILPPLLSEFSRRALNPLRAVAHALMPWDKDAAAFTRNLSAAHALWAQLAAEVRATDVAAAEAAGDTSLRVCLAKVKDPATGELLSDAQLAPQVAAFLVAGFESTGHSVAWALYEVARHPKVQAKLAGELEAAGLAWAPGKPGRPLELRDLSALPYLDQVWREALRLHSVASVGPIRQAHRDVQLRSGVTVPKGTVVWMSTYAMHLSPDNFTEPLRFWPERWQQAATGASGVEAEGAQAEQTPPQASVEPAPAGRCPFGFGSPTPAGNSASPQRSFLAFSHGPRDCMGQALANMEGKAMIAALLSRFAFRPAPRMGTPEDVRAAEVNRLVMQSGKGVWLLLEPRDGAATSRQEGVAASAVPAA